jgi:PST family polysaccharide transporter
MPLFIVGLVLIYMLRSLIVRILFNQDFEPVSDLFFWQLLGDIFKAASMILGFQFFAARMTTAFIVTELLSLLILYTSSIFLIDKIGVEGVVMAHALTYFVYLIVLIGFFRNKL